MEDKAMSYSVTLRGKDALKGFAISLVMWIVGTIWAAYVLSVLWSWFVIPTLHVTKLSIPVAIGLMLIVRFVAAPFGQLAQRTGVHDTSSADRFDPIDFFDLQFNLYILPPLLALGMGWIVTFWL